MQQTLCSLSAKENETWCKKIKEHYRQTITNILKCEQIANKIVVGGKSTRNSKSHHNHLKEFHLGWSVFIPTKTIHTITQFGALKITKIYNVLFTQYFWTYTSSRTKVPAKQNIKSSPNSATEFIRRTHRYANSTWKKILIIDHFKF